MAFVDHCQTADDVRAAARRVHERRREFEAEQKRKALELQRKQQPIVPPAPAQRSAVDLLKIVLEDEERIRSILRGLSNARDAETLIEPQPNQPNPPKIAEIQDAVCAAYGVPVAEMKSARRSGCLIPCRRVSMLLCRILTSHGYPTIGRFHERDHTTVIHSVRAVEWLREKLAEELTREDPLESWIAACVRHYPPPKRTPRRIRSE